MPFLNVVYGGTRTRINTTDIEDVSELRRAIKEEYKNALAEIDAPQLQLYKSSPNERLAAMAAYRALPNEFRVEGGPCVEIRTSPPPSKQSLLLNIIPFPPNSGATHEGLPDPAQKPVLHRPALVNKISDTMKNYMSLLITSPSFTGKTSLANLMYNHWQQNGINVHYISFAAIKKEDDLDDFFRSAIGMSSRDIMTRPGYLIMDETQNIYSHPTFWGNLKSGAQVRRVLAFGVFGLSSIGFERSPSQFQLKWYYDDIKFTDQECMELVDSFKQYQPIARDILIPEVLGDLFQFLNNHPGLVYLALHTICYEFVRAPFNAQDIDAMRALIVKGQLSKQLFKQARCFSIDYKRLAEILGPETDRVMHQLITSDEIPLEEDLMADLHRAGICISDRQEAKLTFSSEIMKVYYRDLYYKSLYGISGTFVVSNWSHETTYSLVKRILELFNPRVFSNTQAIGRDGRRYERIYQDEFYRCCYMLAPSKCHPDVGAIYGSKGFLDFYLDGAQQWGFELLRNGDKLKGHVERFDLASGRYKDIPLDDYAVVDFYEVPGNRQVFVNDKYFQVVFSPDFSTVELSHNGVTEHIVCGKTQ